MSRKSRKKGEEPQQSEPDAEASAESADAGASDVDTDTDTAAAASEVSDTEFAAAAATDADAAIDEVAGEDSAPAARQALSSERTKHVLESLLFVADRVLTAAQLARAVHSRVAEVRPLLGELIEEYKSRGIALCEVGGGYQFRSSAVNAEYVREMVAHRPVRLTRAQLETLALVAYRQPITRPEIDDVRGVDTGSAVKVLLDRSLIKLIGRKDEPGRPLLYGTTPYFLEFFGMKSLSDLPTLKEFTELTEENRELFQRKTGEDLESAQEDLQRQAEAEQERLAQQAEAELEAELSSAGIQEAPDDADADPPEGDASTQAAAPDADDDDHDEDMDDEADIDIDAIGNIGPLDELGTNDRDDQPDR